ncbi:MAG: D-alanyl-D-alanine carboxypeptidase, partial [Gemmatimonadales bacterium]
MIRRKIRAALAEGRLLAIFALVAGLAASPLAAQGAPGDTTLAYRATADSSSGVDALPRRPRSTSKKHASAKSSRTASARRSATGAGASSAWSKPVGVPALATAVGNALSSHTRSGEWGAIIVSLTRGDTLFEQNADAMMQPASTMKMYTSAVALDRFGPDYTFRTSVLRDGQIAADGSLAG